jgi:hypothetical protein
MISARAKDRAVNGTTEGIFAPSRTWRCQSSGVAIVRVVPSGDDDDDDDDDDDAATATANERDARGAGLHPRRRNVRATRGAAVTTRAAAIAASERSDFFLSAAPVG